jgi:hypothetical protein
MPKAGPWTVPDQDECRRIVLQLRDPGWHFTRPEYSDDGKWHARHQGVDLIGATLGDVVTEAEDHALMQQAKSGELWEQAYIPGEPDTLPCRPRWSA